MDQKHTNFKSVLEYFVAHLEFLVTGNKTSIGYTKYIDNLVQNLSFVESGQGYNNHQIQNQIKKMGKI